MTDSPATRMVTALVTLAAITLMCWAELPPWQRALIARAARGRARQLAARVARASGRRAMGLELAGTPEKAAGYDRTERLSRLRDAL